MEHTCGCVHCAVPYPFDDRPSEGHVAVRFVPPPFTVLLDGEDISDVCFEADAVAGLAAVITQDQPGVGHLAPCREHCCATLRRGRVEVRRLTNASR